MVRLAASSCYGDWKGRAQSQKRHCRAFTDWMQPNSRLLLMQAACRAARAAAALELDHAHMIIVVAKRRLHPLVILHWIKIAIQQCIQGGAVGPSCPCHDLQPLHPAAQQWPMAGMLISCW